MERSARSFLGAGVLLVGCLAGVRLSATSKASPARDFLVGDGFLEMPPARLRARYFFLRLFVELAVERRLKRTMSWRGWVWEAR